MGGYAGKILRINLTEGKVSTEPLSPELAKNYLSGRGLGGKMWFDEVDTDVDALAPENKIFISTGALTGTNAPTSGRYMVVTKSPLNGAIAASNSGGYWGAQLKFAGYDMVILEGKAANPVYIAINDDKVEIKDAGHLWGQDVYATTKAVMQEFGDEKAKVLTIGPAGENRSLLASIMNDKFRAAGRSGVGAVMGSKNLKAIVVRGTGKVDNADPDEMKKILSEALGKLKENGVTGQGLGTYGTAVLVNIINENGILPFKNFQESYDPEADKISGETMTANHLIKKDACYRCPIACGRYSKWEGGEGAGPEYEAVWSFGADCGIHDFDAVHVANDLCNKLGMDSISAGCTIATAMELVQRGFVKPEELEGIPLEFGNAQGMVEWTRKMGLGEGFGAKLAMGSYRLAESYGVPELSMSVKKLDIPAYDPRGIQGHGLQYATSNRGGCHVRGYMVSPEILGLPEKLDKDSLEGKAAWVKIFQDLTAVIDSLGLCLFSSFALGLSDYRAIVNAVTGSDYTDAELLACGERIWNLERLQNLRIGMTKADDTLPTRLLKVEIPAGPSKGSVHRLPELLPAYYTERGWDESGVPTAETLKNLGI
ncbi:aldehyde ferredoxin oxidoreductase family protein [Desulfosporosinus youngiae]|uniref:Aldehyde:ferredoxin oxidoreductase n=1 Tax=Desulfosporosinus youngiae DSM 17734 TaxID=768710 RepID=H5Y2F2_9FIRM|nr:aldehyde ferredoxin oxidoreductase family protein [Desulfosporosinus youngiae]EHQ88643.1 aldehyde:ferredoxin oxidoreductase [Desulfosporosinus youngiae DSM 17734]